MVEAVLFDYGGVLTDGGRLSSTPRAVAQFFELDPDQVSIDDLHDSFGRGDISSEKFIAELNSRYGHNRSITAEDYVSINNDIYQPLASIHDLAAKLRSHGIKTGILSNVNGLIADRLMAERGYDNFYPNILSHQVGARKPEPEIYAIALDKLGIPTERVLYIDDNPKNLEPARTLGMLTMHASSESQLLKAIPALFENRNHVDINQLD
jgi:putative hydrolase of the HAD superfamily